MLDKLKSILQDPRQSKLAVGFIILLVMFLPLIVWYAQKQQELRQRASELPLSPPSSGVALSLSPGNSSVLPNTPFTVLITLQAGTYNITGVDFVLKFNESILPATQFTPTTVFNSVLTNEIDHTTGTLHFTTTSTDTNSQITGNVNIGTVTFSPKVLGGAVVDFQSSQITALGVTTSLPTVYTSATYIVAAPTSTHAPVSLTSVPNLVISYSLSYGWNGMGASVTPLATLYAQDILDKSGCAEIDQYINGGWVGHISGIATNNFQIEFAKGYFVKCNVGNTIKQFNIVGTNPLPGTRLNLSNGWNLIASPIDANGNPLFATADLLVNSYPSNINPNIKEVDVWENGGWTGYINGLPTNKFAISSSGAYFLKYQPTSVSVGSLSFPDNPTNTPAPPTSTLIPTSTPIPIAGDVNGDSQLDILDYNIWRNEFLKVVTTSQSDLNHDGKIDLLDFNLWRTAFQTFVTSPSPTSYVQNPTNTPPPSSTVATPTPSTSLLPVSSTYKRVFKTSNHYYDGNFLVVVNSLPGSSVNKGLDAADKICQSTAQNLSGTWKAWLSDSITSASDRLIHATVPYKLLNGTSVANNWADLTDGSLLTKINITELGTQTVDAPAWTNTKFDGTKKYTSLASTCYDWTTRSSYTASQGVDFSTSSSWTDYGGADCFNLDSLYCFEQ